MTSPSSSIVVVDKSGSVDASNLIQSSQHVHQNQPIRAQQVILNEDYLSGDNIVRAGNVNYLIPMPSSTAPMIKPSTIGQHPNSKVHVISNVTLVSKADQPQPQTINFVNSKHVQPSNATIGNRASISSGNYVNISTKSQLQSKMFKSQTMTQMDQQTHIVSAQPIQQQQQQHIITKHLNNASAIVQKVIPRNILVSTSRIQNKIDSTTITRTTPIAQHQTNQMSNVIQIQKPNTIAITKTNSLNVNNIKSTKANQQAIKLVNQTIGGSGGGVTSTIKHGNAGTVKTITTINAISNPNTLQQKNQIKASYGVQNSKTSHQPLQQKSQFTGVHSNISSHSRNNNNNNNNTINANTKIVQHTTPRTIMSMNNMCVQPNVIGQKVTTAKNASTGKYMAQTSSNISNISQTPCMSTTLYRSNENLQTGDQRVTTYRTIQPTETRPSSMTKSIMINHPMNVNSENNGQPSTKKDTEWNQFRHRNGVDIGVHDFQSTSDGSAKSTTIPGSVDDVIMVNGTHMSEEMSARILQSLSQKVVFHTNDSAHNSNVTNITSNRNVQPAQSHRPNQSSSQPIHRAIQPAPFKTAQPSRPYTEYANKSGPEYFRVNTSDIQSTTSTFVDNIPLVSARGDESYSNSNDMEDDIIGEEVRPKPIDASMDSRMRALHALLQDHTYVQWPAEKQAQLTATNTSITSNNNSVHNSSTSVTNSVSSNLSEPSATSLLTSPISKTKPSTTNQLTENIVTGNNNSLPNQTTSPNVVASKYQQQISTTNHIPGYSFGYNEMMNVKDDDANSAISNGSRNRSDIDPGEETETAPEAGNDDDSVTRCICELTHDDGYMICCDKCSVWQHVDCMGIDRQDIPEEYKCELCEPRAIDQNRARTLQLMKRKEQQNFLMMKQSNQASGLSVDSNTSQANTGDRAQLNAFSTIVANKKKGTLSAKSRKVDLFGAANSKRKRTDSSRGGSKRRESKKSLSKRKSHSGSGSNTTTPVKPNSSTVDNDKQSVSLRQWIDNYEAAMTNHYSPELRARLHSITKQMSSSTSTPNLSMLKNIGSLDNKCTTVPHAGGKILISTREIAPNNPVIEIRGKYMLSTQFKPQQQTNSPTSTNGTRNFSKMQPGPFLFFYRLPNDGPEICVDTRTYGNEARFVRRSCRPNAEIVYSIEKGTPHLYIVSLNTIRSSTEITIKHEPHDLESLESGEINAPTSTICGCGLIKDCLFGVSSSSSGGSSSAVQPTSQPGTPTSSKKSSKKPNGHVKDKMTFALNKRSRLDKANRKQAEASQILSGSSSIGILSPSRSGDELDGAKPNENASTKPQTIQEKAQKEQNSEKVQEKANRKNNNSIDAPWTSDQKPEQSQSTTPGKSLSSDSTKVKETASVELTPQSPSKNDVKFDVAPNRSMKSPPTTPISAASTIKSPLNKSSHKKPTRKSTCSMSEDTGDEYSQSTLASKGDKDSKKTVESKKLTREERKMEAIVRAFEKMEKTEQRKNEQKKMGSSAPTSTSSSSKKRNSSSFGKDDKKSNSQSGKRKRKRGKSYSQSSGQKRRRNRYDSHNSDDGNTSDESSTPMMSPTRLHDLDRHPRTPKEHRDKDRYNVTNKTQSSTPPFAVSSACLLIEAAVGPLDNDFKLPTKTKTKKTIMNEWLHQSDGSTSFSSHSHEQQLLSSSTSVDNYTHSDSNTNIYSHEEPRNLSIAAQKIEEFIHLTSGEHIDEDDCSKWSGSPICTSSDAMTVPTPLPTPPLQMGSSVKKRWLRQAISEECSDELLASSATSSPPNGFMAPLKKRRVVRQCSDLNAEDLPSPREDTKDLSLEDENSESMLKGDTEKSLQDDELKVELNKDEEKDVKTKMEPNSVKSEVDENKSMLADIDKFEPIESDEDEEMCSRTEIKDEIDDSQDKSLVSESAKHELISEDSKSQDDGDMASGLDEINDPISRDCNFENTEQKEDEEEDATTSDSMNLNVLPKNEIEDIQQKLHSFHSENLMILQTRNKKRASRATTPTLDEASNSNISKDSVQSSSSGEIATKTTHKFSSDDREYKREPSAKIQNDDETLYNQYTPNAGLASNSVGTNQPMATAHPFSAYVMNSAHRNETNQSITPAQMYQTPPPPPGGFPSVSTQIPANMSSSNSLYHYLENPNRPPGYNPGYNAPIFPIHTNVPPPTLLNSSNYLTKSYSTLSEPSTPVSNVPSTPTGSTTSSCNNSPINPKVLTRTQSADPRLNPPKELPPITPKRKLSINEYRKRKQLTTVPDRPKVDRIEKAESPIDSTKLTQIEDKPKNGISIDTPKETVFSPAPTLLEMQQENLSKRLKSYNLQGLSTSQVELIKTTDTVLENEISTSISEALNATASSSNSSLTSISSPKSDCDFDETEIHDTLPIQTEKEDDDEREQEQEPEEQEQEEALSTSDTSAEANPGDSKEDSKVELETNENEFDLEPAEPQQSESIESTDT
ncbi:inactive histone-lysine N-methyltransferase 2E isoform X2 [Contarinia nasturtii]|uniref:inactive histone-lysine N-methyltransferase 2E isoform X2 n=1 Tax=Contarinia nasturtii TaxID=265458 RepID=UPI0012D37FDE|nr:inactive histone-lysine N-methyltransferase 2E isoform X2 [Contarinia nasturtii]